MRILNCHIENFGKLSDETISFDKDNLNIICEENGWGKSTLAAFIKVMFFGFDNESKRDDYENERKRYKPWQNGVYGGQLSFEVEDRHYEITRIFGAKDKDDTFELRNLDKNLESSDYTEKIGEELFGIDSKSFTRTMYLKNNSGYDGVTDGINAKLGNISDTTGDINNYEQAYERLVDILNFMSPRRKTGELYKQKDKLTELKQSINKSDSIYASLDELNEKKKNELLAIDKLKEEQTELVRKQKSLSHYKDNEFLKKEYDRLLGEYDDALKKYEFAGTFIKNEIEDKDELKEYKQKAYLISEKEKTMEALAFSEEDEAKYEELKRDIDEYEREAAEAEIRAEEERKVREAHKHHFAAHLHFGKKKLLILKGLLYIFIETFCVMYTLNSSQGNRPRLLIFVIGVIAVLLVIDVVDIVMVISETRRERQSYAAGKKKFKPVQSEYNGDANDAAEDEEDHNDKMYRQNLYIFDKLTEQKKDYKDAKEVYEAYNTEVKNYITALGYEPLPDLYNQLIDIEKKNNEYNDIKKTFGKINMQKKAFEREHDIEELKAIENLSPDITLSEINDKLKLIMRNTEAHNKNIASYNRQIDELEEKLEYISDCESEYDSLEEIYEENNHKYKILDETKLMLEEAKAAFTKKYTEPIKSGFDKYYNKIEQIKDNTYELDANINLYRKELGLNRETRFLSSGYKDLAGLCMRMALIDAMYRKERPFIIIDDMFVNFDNDKLDMTLSLLNDISKEYQIIYFTCNESRA